jgi:hypothetical protein
MMQDSTGRKRVLVLQEELRWMKKPNLPRLVCRRQVPGILRIMKFGTEWRRITMDIGPIYSTKERMCLKLCKEG